MSVCQLSKDTSQAPVVNCGMVLSLAEEYLRGSVRTNYNSIRDPSLLASSMPCNLRKDTFLVNLVLGQYKIRDGLGISPGEAEVTDPHLESVRINEDVVFLDIAMHNIG